MAVEFETDALHVKQFQRECEQLGSRVCQAEEVLAGGSWTRAEVRDTHLVP